ncbi:MAG: NAD(P)(+) transhydrogenase (Re/Si-specific) subunit beta [Bacteroidales bacterium]
MDKVLGTLNGIEFTIGLTILELSYLIAALLFVYGLKLLSHPVTARRGNLWAAAGMGLAMVTTLLLHKNSNGEGIALMNVWVIILFVGLGSVIGWVVARKVKMTAMPQLVSLYNASGGAASMLVALLEYPNAVAGDVASILVTILGLVIGAIAFSGSVIAYGKLDGKVGDIMKPFMTYLNLFLLIITIALSAYLIASSRPPTELVWLLYILTALALIYGIMFVMPIGGADMPVVISLLNALTGVAAAMAGFIYNNQAMILGGILVGAAGMILTILMCNAMNRSLLNVIVGSFGGSSGDGAAGVDKTVREILLSDAAVLLSYSQKVYIVPGYGLAVAQAQHLCHELDVLLANKGVEVKYAIHPVAGRMPGHMNVLLAEADVPYEKLMEMDDANEEMPNTDVVIVVGANDVVNPAAEDDPGSPIYGMPIIKVLDAKNIIVMKRSMATGYAAIPNNLFYHPKNRMLFGDAKATLQKLVAEIKSL